MDQWRRGASPYAGDDGGVQKASSMLAVQTSPGGPYPPRGTTVAAGTPDDPDHNPGLRNKLRRDRRAANHMKIQRVCLAILYSLDIVMVVVYTIAYINGQCSQDELLRAIRGAIGFAIFVDWAAMHDEKRAQKGRNALRYPVAAPREHYVTGAVEWQCPLCQTFNDVPPLARDVNWPLMQQCVACHETVVVPDVRRHERTA
ncbi:hypothetical protein [Bifidobacterium thermophilum]|uniref:Uncharacterized protein n=1 Tax=Bifidobacterium thermophilum TaxID=33905 RepID=A0A7X9NRT1_9BIFI|nr:hypothetical protein [Bifidobacterium thermophilum]NME61512.1 hypothetical protein [Bifidobacterium thermophilum]